MLSPKKRLLLLLLSLILLSSSKCDFRPPPQTELCGAYVDGGVNMTCHDERREPKQYDRELQVGDLCTSAVDYGELKKYCEGLRTDLKKCKRRKKR